MLFRSIGEADRLVPQEANPEAANALLKFLEEPPPSTFVILTATDATQVLPTIRSRAALVRLNRLSDAEVEEFLRQVEPSLSATELKQRVSQAEGSIGAALVGAERGGAPREAARQLLAAITHGRVGRLERSLRQGPWQARGEFTDLLDGMLGVLREDLRAETTGQRQRRTDPRALLTAIERVEAARDRAQSNLNPQLLLVTLTAELAEVL